MSYRRAPRAWAPRMGGSLPRENGARRPRSSRTRSPQRGQPDRAALRRGLATAFSSRADYDSRTRLPVSSLRYLNQHLHFAAAATNETLKSLVHYFIESDHGRHHAVNGPTTCCHQVNDSREVEYRIAPGTRHGQILHGE